MTNQPSRPADRMTQEQAEIEARTIWNAISLKYSGQEERRIIAEHIIRIVAHTNRQQNVQPQGLTPEQVAKMWEECENFPAPPPNNAGYLMYRSRKAHHIISTDMPRLLSEVKRQAEEIAALKDQVDILMLLNSDRDRWRTAAEDADRAAKELKKNADCEIERLMSLPGYQALTALVELLRICCSYEANMFSAEADRDRLQKRLEELPKNFRYRLCETLSCHHLLEECRPSEVAELAETICSLVAEAAKDEAAGEKPPEGGEVGK